MLNKDRILENINNNVGSKKYVVTPKTDENDNNLLFYCDANDNIFRNIHKDAINFVQKYIFDVKIKTDKPFDELYSCISDVYNNATM